MNLEHEFITSQMIDGQLAYILDPRAFELLINIPIIENQSIGAMDIVRHMMDFVNKYHSFSIAFYPLGKFNKWMFCLLFHTSDKLQRVQIENVHCTNCNWTGIIANPTFPELYLGCPDRWAVQNEAYESPKVNCPTCNHGLPRYAIWTSS